jgi:polyphosphate kinase
LSENISVRSIVGRFLEHHRIFCFHNGGADDVYLSSADWMGRNLFRRIEVAWPVLDKKLKQRVINEGLQPYLEDSVDAWILEAEGEYRPARAPVKAGAKTGRTANRNGLRSSQQTLLLELSASVGAG